MENKIGVIFQIVVSITMIIGGIIIIMYRKKFLELQKRYFSKQKDFLNREISESLEKRSIKNSYTLIVGIALFIIVVAIIQLVNALALY